MGSEGRLVAIAIAVAGSVPPIYLSGAINSARRVKEWAEAQGYETTLITDEKTPVTKALLRGSIEAALKPSPQPPYRLLVYFAGHGLIREMEEGLWLLSDWKGEGQAIAVEALKRRLFTYGPRQVCIISDACRSLPTDVNQASLTPDALLGVGPNTPDPFVAVDKFAAAQDGTETFTIPGADPEDDRCLFSGVLIEGLWGLEGLQAGPFSKILPDKVTSRSLGSYLQLEVPARAAMYGLTLNPLVSPTFPEEADYYFTKTVGGASPKFPPWPPKEALLSKQVPPTAPPAHAAPSPAAGIDYEAAPSPGIAVSTSSGPQAAPYRSARRLLSSVIYVRRPPPQIMTLSGVTIDTDLAQALPCRMWFPQNASTRRVGPGETWALRNGPYLQVPNAFMVNDPIPTLIQFQDGLFGTAVVMPNLFTSLLREQYGVTQLLYQDLQDQPGTPVAAELAIEALENGTLRADTVTDWAVQLRELKHVDPVLGVISAYLYDAINDIDSIRRMAGFYIDNNQAIPYDIALLGGLGGEWTDAGFEAKVPAVQARAPRSEAEKQRKWTYCAMPEKSGRVAGSWPWMRQGWVLLDDPTDVGSALVLPGLIEHRSGLMRSRFTTFEADAGLALAKRFGMQSSDS